MIVCGSDIGNGTANNSNCYLSYRYQQGQSQQPTLLDNLRCTGRETSLISCPHPGIGNEDCDHFEDVGLECTSETTPTTSSMSSFKQLHVHYPLQLL